MKRELKAWAISTGEPRAGLIGHLRFDHIAPIAPWHKGVPLSLFCTRALARAHLPRIKGPSERGLYPRAKVVPVRVSIEVLGS